MVMIKVYVAVEAREVEHPITRLQKKKLEFPTQGYLMTCAMQRLRQWALQMVAKPFYQKIR